MPEHRPRTIRMPLPPLVLIGMTTNDLAPVEEFLDALPPHGDWSFVLACLPELATPANLRRLARAAPHLRLRDVSEGDPVQPGVIHVLPLTRGMEVHNEAFHPMRPRGADAPLAYRVDALLQSLAGRPADRTFAVCLCATVSEGIVGLEQLQARGGLALIPPKPDVHVPECIARQCPVAEMPMRIAAALAQPQDAADPSEASPAGLLRIFELIEQHRHVDFTAYNRDGIRHRLFRRMRARGIASFQDYARLLDSDDTALDELFEELLTGATGFFRDLAAFDALRRTVLDPAARQDTDRPLRIWAVACATGQEAYSVAIAAQEALEAAGSTRILRVIATDIQPGALDTASAGVYPAKALAHLPDALRDKYFLREGGTCRVRPELRRRVVFSVQDVLSDPPLLNMDLVVCRNLLVYLSDEARDRVISMIRFGLRPGGALLLGHSESPGQGGEAFEPLDPTWKIFRKKAGTDTQQEPGAPPERRGDALAFEGIGDDGLRAEAYRAMLAEAGLSALLLSEQGTLLGEFGLASALVSPKEPGGLHPAILPLIRSALTHLQSDRLHVTRHRLHLDLGARHRQAVMLHLAPLEVDTGVPMLLVLVDIATDRPAGPGAAASRPLSRELDTRQLAMTGQFTSAQEDAARIGAILDALGIGVAVLNRRGRISRLSGPMARILGTDLDWIGQPVAALPLGEDFAGLPGLVDEVLNGGASGQVDGVQCDLPLEVRIFPGSAPDGAVLLFVPETGETG